MPLDPDELADELADAERRRRELEAAGQLGLPEDALGLDEDEELLTDEDEDDALGIEDDTEDEDLEPDELAGDEPAGAVTTEGRRVSWRPRPPTVNPKPPTEPIKPPPPTGTGKVIEVRSKRDLENIRNGQTYQWVGGFILREQLSLSGLSGVTLVDARIEGARESNIYARGCRDLTLTGGDLSRSKTKSGILLDAECEGLRMFRVTGEENEEHFIYVGSHKKNGKPFLIEDCVGRRNHRCFIQVNLENQSHRVVGGHVLRCTLDGNATEQGSQANLGAWDKGLFQDNSILNGADDGVIFCGIDGPVSRNCQVIGNTFRNNRDAPLKTADGSTGHVLSRNVFDELPVMKGFRSDGSNVGPNGKRF